MNKRSEQINQILERYYVYISLGLIGAIVLLMLNFIIWPQYQTMQSSGILQYNNITDVMAQRKIYLQQLQAMKLDYQDIDQRVVRAIDIALPATYTEGPVYTEVEQLFKGTQFVLDSVNVSSSTGIGDDAVPTDTVITANGVAQNYKEVSLSLNVTAIDGSASYQDYLELLKQIEQSPHLMNLESISYSPNSTSYTLVLKTYQRTL
jgi:hypothetical protein